jgi:hypothetical protein
MQYNIKHKLKKADWHFAFLNLTHIHSLVAVRSVWRMEKSRNPIFKGKEIQYSISFSCCLHKRLFWSATQGYCTTNLKPFNIGVYLHCAIAWDVTHSYYITCHKCLQHCEFPSGKTWVSETKLTWARFSCYLVPTMFKAINFTFQ